MSPGFGIYVHVPFCIHRCWYCDFNTVPDVTHLHAPYMSALVRDACEALSAPFALDERPTVTSVFFGGGTPSLVDSSALLAVLDAIRSAWPVAPDVEVTVECNPETIDLPKLEAYRDGGVTRLSFGVQSLDDRLLAALGRTHDAATAVRALRLARRVFDDVNLDLIFGIPGESDDTWLSTLRGALALEPSHISAYGLTYEDGTPLDSFRKLGKITPVDDDDVARRWEIADGILTAAGLPRYEISNWGRPCRHNLLYWSCGEYLGIGAGAHSHLGGVRSWTVKPPATYTAQIADGRRPVAGSETIDADGRASEAMFLGLRRTAGIDASEFADVTGRDLGSTFGEQLEAVAARGLITWDGTTARLTQPMLANEAVAAFLP